MHACAYYIYLITCYLRNLPSKLTFVLPSEGINNKQGFVRNVTRTNEGNTYLIIIRLGRSNQDRIYISLRMHVLVLPVRLERFRRGLRMAPCPSLNPYGYVTCPWGRN